MKTTWCQVFSMQAPVVMLETSLIVIICGTISKTVAVANSSFGLQNDIGLQTPLSVDKVPNFPRTATAEAKALSETTTPLSFHKSSGLQGRGVGQPERTRPFVVVEGERRSLKEALQNGHPDTLQCGLQVGGAVYLLNLEKNKDLLPSPPTVFFYPADGTGVIQDQSPVTHCFYHGSVQGFPRSRIALSTCSGLRGVVAINSTLSFELEPEEEEGEGQEEDAEERSGGEKEEGVHVVYSARQLPSLPGICGVPHQPVPTLDVPLQPHRSKRDVLGETKYIELVLVVDHSEYLNYEKNNRTIVYRMLDISNQVDWFFRPLSVRVALVGLEIWSDGDRIRVDGSPADTLERFLDWRARDLLPRLRHDNAQLVLGSAFKGRTVGMASQSSMCSSERSGGISVDNLVSILGVASTVAHELGHNLGMLHDTQDRRCLCLNPAQQGGCIMEPATGFLPGQMFSSCSAEDLSVSLLHGGGACLFNVPQPKRLLGGPRCGNLHVEQGEECDCGLTHECEDPCCNAATCRLVPGARCSSDGLCCDNCQMRSAGFMCRDSLGECDLAEHCTGTSPHCPPNLFLQDGNPCEGGGAYCYGGVCASLDSQCRDLWGTNSTRAPEVCFLSVNKLGNKYGNCGQVPNGTYVPCSDSDVHCGKIQCQGGNDRPLLGARVQILSTKVRRNQSELVCRTSFFDLGEDVSDPATVAHGTACGPGKACLDRQCRDAAVFGVEECQRKCSGHGVCNSNHNCHCDVGWAPPDCKYSGYGGSVDSGPMVEPRDSHGTRVALLVTSLIVLLGALFFLLLRYPRLRRRLFSFRSILFLKGPSQQQSRTPALERMAARGGDQAQPLRPNPKNDIPLTLSLSKAEDKPLPPSKPLPPDPVSKPTQSVGERPRPPTKPLPPDPVPPGDKVHVPARPPPPTRQLPAVPPTRPAAGVAPNQGPRGSPVPTAGPARPPLPPPPPPLKVTPKPKGSHSPHQRAH
ncbi:disintegrin and metalloproteinase domain-containing protein 15-like isoform X2 [Anguilla rostrata]|uniref:disintegrin and metalloproteinase domain-containing protein 15-like isoform X2 n=1 Tax=Anguilla rostrata TaxID=7938 RepID=UPI0030CD5BA1